MAYVEKLPEFLSFKEHAKIRSMWKGSDIISDKLCWILDGRKFKRVTANCSDALIKCFDEILVNAIDRYIEIFNCPEESGGPVTVIKVKYDKTTGMISVTNNGQGMPILYMDSINKYSVEGMITKEYGGTNFDDHKDPDKVTGGLHGLGMKLVVIDSDYFEIETVDFIRRKYYKQICRNGMEIIENPTILPLSNNIKCHTTITFKPNFAKLCRKSPKKENIKWFNRENSEVFSKIIEYRMYQTAAFISSINYRYVKDTRIEYNRKPEIYFNEKQISFNSLIDFAKMFEINNPIEIIMEHSKSEVSDLVSRDEKYIRFPWYIVIGTNSARKFERISLLNGVSLNGGSHCNLIIRQIMDSLSSNIEKYSNSSSIKINENLIQSFLFIIDCKHIPLPQFSSQTKETLTLGAKELNEMKKVFVIDPKTIRKIWIMIKKQLDLYIVRNDSKIVKQKMSRMPIRKYKPASKLGPHSMCFIPEGDSAEKIIRDIIHSKKSPLKYTHCGTYNIQGVPMNALRKIEEIKSEDGSIYLKKHKDLMENVALQGLVKILGLDYSEDYYFGPPEDHPDIENMDDDEINRLYEKRKLGDIKYNKLPYGKGIVISTDQDLDGTGNICSLLLVFIMCIWPELIKRGFVKRLITPIMRIYSKNNIVHNFYSKKEFIKWAEENFGGEDKIPKEYSSPYYYKGLAGHSEEEVIDDIGVNIDKNIHTFSYDEACEIKMKISYGHATSGRKKILSTPVTREYDEYNIKRKIIPCSDHFDIESKSFQLEFIGRKLKSAIDGLIPSQRKAIAGARKNSDGKIKVYQLTGKITESMKYQHGETSMNDTIIKMAQRFTGSNNIPPFVAISNGFGDRVNGRGKTGSPRYIDTKYNKKVMDLMFPKKDDYLLEYQYEEGSRCEPMYYVPILPYSILETSTTTSVGWKISCWARNLDSVIENVKRMIDDKEPIEMPVWLPKGMSSIKGRYHGSKNDVEICKGSYLYHEDKNIVVVTQLPLKLWSCNLYKNLLGVDLSTGKNTNKKGEPLSRKIYVTKVLDHTASDINKIIIQLEDDSIEKINEKYGNEYISPIEDYLGLTKPMTKQLNMITELGAIKEFENYEDIIKQWFPIRKQLYICRINREIKILELTIEFKKNILRFIKMDSTKKINIDKDFDEEERVRILSDAGFIKFNSSTLRNPKYVKNENLEYSVKVDGANYSYIDSITINMKSKRSISAIKLEIEKLTKELSRIKSVTWKELWLTEIDELHKMIELGIKTKWLYKNTKHKFRSV
jgi:DNA topoisomerase II